MAALHHGVQYALNLAGLERDADLVADVPLAFIFHTAIDGLAAAEKLQQEDAEAVHVGLLSQFVGGKVPAAREGGTQV